MTDKPTTVTGTVAKIAEWKSGKGFFLNFESDQNDYYKFGKAAVSEGQTATFECKPGSKGWDDKVELIKKVEATNQTVDVAKLKKDAEEIVKESIKTGDRVYMDKQELIVKQVCLKVAGELHSHIITRSAKIPGKAVSESIMKMADRFFCYIIEAEEPEPDEEMEEPEPPEAK